MDRPAPVFVAYRNKLLATGMVEQEVNEQLATITRLMRTQTDGWRLLFNNIYAHPQPGFNTEPNALLVAAVAGRTPGRALDVATGQGRNALFLAHQGWTVTAIDIADEGLKQLTQAAAQADLTMHTVLTGNDAFDFGTATWNLIVLTYAPVPLTASRYVQRLWDALQPGGLVVVESFASEVATHGRRPVDLDPADLQRAFADFHLHHFADTVALTDWERQELRLVRMIAEKK